MRAGTFAIVTRVFRAPMRWRRSWRLPVVLVGGVLTLAGTLCSLLLTIAVGLAVVTFRFERELEVLDDGALLLAIVGLAVGSWILLDIGARLVRGERRSVLFLRRFGFTAATQVLTEAISEGLGRRWRLITLDDLQVAPVGAEGPNRFRLSFDLVLWSTLVVVAVWLVPPFIEREFGDTIDERVAEIESGGLWSLTEDELTGIAVAGLLVGSAVLRLVGGVLSSLFRFGARLASGRGEERGAVRIERADEVDRVVRRIERRTNRIRAPRLTVVRSANDLWQTVVHRFADCADVVLIDVSVASPGLLWELTELSAEHSTEWILVGHRKRLAALEADPAPDAVRLRSLLEGQTVVAYDPDPPSSAQFQYALRARLTHVQ